MPLNNNLFIKNAALVAAFCFVINDLTEIFSSIFDGDDFIFNLGLT